MHFLCMHLPCVHHIILANKRDFPSLRTIQNSPALLPTYNSLFDNHNKDGDHSWTYLFSGYSNGGGYHIKRLYINIITLSVYYAGSHFEWQRLWHLAWNLPVSHNLHRDNPELSRYANYLAANILER